MDIKEKTDKMMSARGWTQRRLAEELGINETTLTNARAGRRPLPTHAVIKLERMRGTDDHSIIEQLLKTAACIALVACAYLFNDSLQGIEYAGVLMAGWTDYKLSLFLVAVLIAVLADRQQRPGPLGGRRMVRTT